MKRIWYRQRFVNWIASDYFKKKETAPESSIGQPRRSQPKRVKIERAFGSRNERIEAIPGIILYSGELI